MFDFDKSYWNRQGPQQAKYDEMQDAGWEFNPTTIDTFHRYYRFHNDGDATPRIRRLETLLGWRGLQNHPEYIAYCQRMEERVTQRIEVEYRRFKKAQLSNRPAR